VSARAAVFGVLAVATLTSAGDAPGQPAGEVVAVYAAGSLRAALIDVAREFEGDRPGTSIRFTFGASGLLKDRLLAGEAADVFASANMEHPEALQQAGKSGPVQRFARNSMCALARPNLHVASADLVGRMLDPAVRLATSTPVADPSGDYAWEVFRRVEQSGRADASRILGAKALQLTGGPASPPAPPGPGSVYGNWVAQGGADIFLTYCTNATVAAREQPALQVVALPAAIDVSASYGIVALAGASAPGRDFVAFVLGPRGQAILARHGFAPR
jgi:ABC-type molybdate transport system substrate-binding protein